MGDEPPPEPAPPEPTATEPAPRVTVSDDQDEVAVDTGRWAQLAREVLEDHGVTGELELCFVDASTIARLKGEYLGDPVPTDVLAFPLDAADDRPVGPVIVGSVVVCPEVAARQARSAGRAVDDELALLVVHGVLHVLGHDHAEPHEARRMRLAERTALAAHHRPGTHRS